MCAPLLYLSVHSSHNRGIKASQNVQSIATRVSGFSFGRGPCAMTRCCGKEVCASGFVGGVQFSQRLFVTSFSSFLIL